MLIIALPVDSTSTFTAYVERRLMAAEQITKSCHCPHHQHRHHHHHQHRHHRDLSSNQNFVAGQHKDSVSVLSELGTINHLRTHWNAIYSENLDSLSLLLKFFLKKLKLSFPPLIPDIPTAELISITSRYFDSLQT